MLETEFFLLNISVFDTYQRIAWCVYVQAHVCISDLVHVMACRQKEIEKKSVKETGAEGWLLGATGGLGGGEVMLKEYLIEEIKREQAEKKRLAKLAALSAPKPPTLSPTAPLLMPGKLLSMWTSLHNKEGVVVKRFTY